MNTKRIKNFTDMLVKQKAFTPIVSTIVMLPIIYMYLKVLQFSLKLYPIGINWWIDIMMHTEKLNSMPYMVYGFFYTFFILGFPIVFVASTVACILFSPKWRGSHFGLAMLFPGMFVFVVIPISCIGHVFV